MVIYDYKEFEVFTNLRKNVYKIVQ